MDEIRTKDRQAPDEYPAEKARQGEIILRRPWQRALFILGLVGGVILAVLARIWEVW